MTHLYFHCAGPNGVVIDKRGAEVLDLIEARDRAIMLARFIVESAYGVDDFSDWQVYVSDEEDDELLFVSFDEAKPAFH